MTNNYAHFVQRKLLEFGITPNLIGFWYICDAIEVLRRENCRMPMRDVCVEVSKKHNCSYVSVERSIRTAVMKADFSDSGEASKSKMRSKEFLYFLFLLVKREEEDGKQDQSQR